MTRKASNSGRRALFRTAWNLCIPQKLRNSADYLSISRLLTVKDGFLYLQPSDNIDTACCAPHSWLRRRGCNPRQRLGGWRPGWRRWIVPQQIWHFMNAAVITSNVSYSIFVIANLTTVYQLRTVYAIKWSMPGWMSEVWVKKYGPAHLENLRENHESIWRNYWTRLVTPAFDSTKYEC